MVNIVSDVMRGYYGDPKWIAGAALFATVALIQGVCNCCFTKQKKPQPLRLTKEYAATLYTIGEKQEALEKLERKSEVLRSQIREGKKETDISLATTANAKKVYELALKTEELRKCRGERDELEEAIENLSALRSRPADQRQNQMVQETLKKLEIYHKLEMKSQAVRSTVTGNFDCERLIGHYTAQIREAKYLGSSAMISCTWARKAPELKAQIEAELKVFIKDGTISSKESESILKKLAPLFRV